MCGLQAPRRSRAAAASPNMADQASLAPHGWARSACAARTQLFDARAINFDVLLDRASRMLASAHRRLPGPVMVKRLGKARHGEAEIGFRPLLPLVLPSERHRAANIGPP